jgi:4-hydroxy-tetrahydrodipicolinate synthase
MSLRKKFTGTGIAIVTPFNENGTIDWASYKRLIQFWIEGKVEYLVVLGTTGESATVHGAEKQEVFSFVKNEVAGRVPIVAGIGGNDTNEVVRQFREFDLSGYDAILSVSPYYNKPNQEGIFQHYKALDAATPLPIIMYNVPGRTGMSVSAETTLRIARDCPNIFATKEASGNFDLINQLIKNKPEHFMVISGDDRRRGRRTDFGSGQCLSGSILRYGASLPGREICRSRENPFKIPRYYRFHVY